MELALDVLHLVLHFSNDKKLKNGGGGWLLFKKRQARFGARKQAEPQTCKYKGGRLNVVLRAQGRHGDQSAVPTFIILHVRPIDGRVGDHDKVRLHSIDTSTETWNVNTTNHDGRTSYRFSRLAAGSASSNSA